MSFNNVIPGDLVRDLRPAHLDLRTTEELADEEAQTSDFFREEILGLPARPGVIR